MKYFFPLLAAAFLLCVNANAQVTTKEETATFEDGTKINFNVVENVGDDQFRNTVGVISLSDQRSITILSVMYTRFEPKKFYARGEVAYIPSIGLGGISVGGTYFLHHSYSQYTMPLTIGTGYTFGGTTRYNIKLPAVKNKHLGVDFQLAYNKYSMDSPQIVVDNTRNYLLTSLATPEIAIGFGYVADRHAVLKVEGEKFIGGSRLFHLTADVLFAPGAKFEYTALDSAAMSADLEANDFLEGKVGFRVQVQGQSTFKYSKKAYPSQTFGFFYRVGAMKSPYTRSSGFVFGGICPIFGLGIFCNFG